MKFSARKTKWLALIGLIIIAISFWLIIFFCLSPSNLTVAFLSVGQGDAILITTPHHRQILLDTGPGRAVLSPLNQQLSFFDRHLDLILLSHGDTDHSGGIFDILSHYQLDYLLAGRWLKKNENSVETFNIETGTRINLEPNIYLDIIEGGETDQKGNDGSVVAKLSYGSTTFLLAGDSTAREENEEIFYLGKYLQADVLKVAHHGSRTANQFSFLQMVQPKYAVISVGANNRYGHPNKETLSRLQTVGAEILRTDEQGTIVFISDGKNLVKK